MTVESSIIHIAIAFDRNFLIPYYVLLTSIFNNDSDSKFVFHTIAEGINDSEKGKIKSFITEHNGEVVFYNMDSTTVKSFVSPDPKHISAATYYRIYFPDLVPDFIEKLIYLDTDVLVLKSLKSLYSYNLNNFPVAAVPDIHISSYPPLDIEEGDYFNAGIMLIDVKLWREQKIAEKAIQLIYAYPEKMTLGDQDGLNGVLKKNWFKLDTKYNLTFYNIPETIKKKEMDSFIKDTVIIHFTTQNKPWLMTCRNRFSYLYFKYLNLSPVANKRRFLDMKNSRKVPISILTFFKIKLKELVIDHTSILSRKSL